MATVSINLEAPIVPGVSAAGVNIGQALEELPRPKKTTHLTNVDLLEFPSVTIWVKDGTVYQIGVRDGYNGRLDEVVGIGSTIADVADNFGDVTEDEYDNLVASSRPGWCFETTEWRNCHEVKFNLEARVTEILVHH